ncbi:DNA repair protein RecO [Candidatus Methylacidiphilum infernorum]|uniref:Recombinational DNA repair protein RecO n=2 Tax=Candidatus Methylacidiphilum infernorum TaxID=511746 RepID=B3DX96_METI4|nr:DNA repair protein RecO [Candidatus Methylacidiphilum infernorum]ACD83805.1 Recombinational DNA repair protein RecO [Methylacidiphilum infernorum V4]QSR87265.1 DNA repair protein RecO [Candidatus Methylacidiphilum infernorum]
MDKHSGPLLSTTAIAFRKYPFSETSTIIYWISPMGCIKTLAKGSRKSGTASFAPIDLFYECEIVFYVSRRSDLYLLKEYRIVDPMLALRRDWVTLLCSSYFVELIAQTAEERTPLPECFILLEKALGYIKKKPVSLKIVELYEKRLLAIHGLQGAEIDHLYEQAPGGGKRLWEKRKQLRDCLKP